jgi:tetratricopeptide (TPR) repeat protein
MRPSPLSVLAWLSTLIALALPLHAQRVRWEPPGGTLALRQTSQLSLIFEDCEPNSDVTLPAIPNVTLGEAARGEQSSFNIVNGQASRTKTVYYTYPIRPAERRPIQIPGFTVQTDKGPMTVAPVTFEVGEATVGNSSIPLEAAASSRLSVGAGQLWAGEVVPIDYVLSVANRFPANIASAPEWSPTPLVVEEWSKPEPGSTVVNGETRNTMAYRTRGYVRQPGTYSLSAINQLVNLRVPSSGFSIFQAFQAEQYTITSNAPQLVVRPLPSPTSAGFNGAVGAFQLTATVVPANATVGEPITWTLELTGTGNWPDIPGLPAREVSRDFRIVQPQARRTMAEGRLFEGTLSEDVVLIPTRPGTYRLGPVTWSYFDPKSGRYQTEMTDVVTVTVTAATPAPTTPPGSGTDATSGAPADAPGDHTPTVRSAPAPAAPGAIPRDPIPPAAPAAAPWPLPAFVGTCVALIALVPLAWLGFAWHHASTSDPGRPARQARLRLRSTLAAMRRSSRQDQPRLLQQWQRDAITLWNLRRAAPSGAAFETAPVWSTLWIESERALYRNDTPLPSDWIDRAEKALQQRKAPPFQPLSVFRPRHWLPWLLLGLLWPVASDLRADAPEDAYRKGQFRAAERGWKEAISVAPTDWSAHHNLALALAQQQRWAEAAAHAVAAFVQHPSHPSVRWHFSYALGRAGYTPPILGEFHSPDSLHRLAWQLSPSHWQWVLLLAVGLLALAGGLVLWRLYHRTARGLGWIAGSIVAFALLLALASALSLQRYGAAADPRAVLIWKSVPLRSLPTDVATEQHTSTLAPGSVAIVDHAFLGWRRLAFPNGQTGWVRREDFVPLWEQP